MLNRLDVNLPIKLQILKFNKNQFIINIKSLGINLEYFKDLNNFEV